MMNRKSHLWGRIFSASVLIILSAFSIRAQATDPNPDSPTPVLISESDSVRALATAPDRLVSNGRGGAVKIKSPAFPLYARAVLYVTNLDLMDGENATAFRLNVEAANGRRYRFPVVNLQSLKGRAGVYALTIETRDELGFYDQPEATGDVSISVLWRGLESNRLRFGLGKTGGFVRDEAGMQPSPMPTTQQTKVGKNDVPDAPDYIGYRHSGDRIRFMEQATFGPTAALDERIRRIGLRTWLADQFEETYPTNPYPNFPLMPSLPPTDCDGNANVPDIDPLCARNHYTMYPVQNWFFKEAFYGNAQLKHRTTWALSQMWVVSGVETQQSRHFTEYYKILGNNAFGNYRTIMQQMTLNAGMGNYLDMVRSTRNNPNENYAREILQLFSIGLFQLNTNGTPKLDANNQPIPTYDQATVNGFTKVFTGWNFCEVTASCPNRPTVAPIGANYIDPMLLNQNNHNIEAKTLLDYPGAVNKNIAAGLNGTTELNLAIDNIYNHPNVAPFVSRFLIQHLVTSDPTPAYVERVATVFDANRTSPTQLKEVVKAILLDPEARGNVKTDPNYGKLREPVQLATNLMRQFKVQSADGLEQSDGYIALLTASMAQNVFYSPTVFNFYSPDYIVPGPGLNGPEFAILTTGTAISRTNFVNTMAFGRVNVSVPVTPSGTSLNFTELQALAAADATSNRLLDELDTKLMHGTMTAQNRSTILTAVNAVAATDPLNRARTAVYLVATSSQYQVQR